jgi:hypothetical protein
LSSNIVDISPQAVESSNKNTLHDSYVTEFNMKAFRLCVHSGRTHLLVTCSYICSYTRRSLAQPAFPLQRKFFKCV